MWVAYWRGALTDLFWYITHENRSRLRIPIQIFWDGIPGRGAVLGPRKFLPPNDPTNCDPLWYLTNRKIKISQIFLTLLLLLFFWKTNRLNSAKPTPFSGRGDKYSPRVSKVIGCRRKSNFYLRVNLQSSSTSEKKKKVRTNTVQEWHSKSIGEYAKFLVNFRTGLRTSGSVLQNPTNIPRRYPRGIWQ